MLDIVYFSNVTGNTARLVGKLNVPSNKFLIPLKSNRDLKVNKPFILILPTYGDSEGKGMVPHQVKRFLKDEDNAKLLRGVISSGNRNFGKEFGLAGDLISYKFKVPLLHKFEIAGSDEDLDIIENILNTYNPEEK